MTFISFAEQIEQILTAIIRCDTLHARWSTPFLFLKLLEREKLQHANTLR